MAQEEERRFASWKRSPRMRTLQTLLATAWRRPAAAPIILNLTGIVAEMPSKALDSISHAPRYRIAPGSVLESGLTGNQPRFHPEGFWLFIHFGCKFTHIKNVNKTCTFVNFDPVGGRHGGIISQKTPTQPLKWSVGT